MASAKKFGMWIFFAILGCGGLETVPVSDIPDGGAGGEIGSDADRGADDGARSIIYGIGLCMDRRSGAPDRVIFTPKPKESACQYEQDSTAFAASYGQPKILELHGRPYVSYRIDAVRQRGYITISHRDGDVTRSGNTFSWYVVPRSEQPTEARVLSLSANANFELVVR